MIYFQNALDDQPQQLTGWKIHVHRDIKYIFAVQVPLFERFDRSDEFPVRLSQLSGKLLPVDAKQRVQRERRELREEEVEEEEVEEEVNIKTVQNK